MTLQRTLPTQSPRLLMKPGGSQTGIVDGAWWPQSNDLASEMPALQDALDPILGRIGRVAYSRQEWPLAPSSVSINGHPVKLDGYRFQARQTLNVQGVNGRTVAILLISPEASSDTAHAILRVAAQPHDVSTVADLLDPQSSTLLRHQEGLAAQQSWESEGGRSAQRTGLNTQTEQS
ncbi:DUF5994 family protein [Hoyosella altamirensis]|uniref:Uncharacterized protein n=1 Tax=Hoyosella altamirensis TaxID=616997 RepID=A0A839RH09_9ACTN|nr:DUF5994 family protein [Hoyosella altamirensis]MBB3035700.1 hypothetical protein [Hoyosella altamirensis]